MTNETSTPRVPAGWYPDHTGEAQLRWWDGASWTDHVQPNGPELSNPYQLKTIPAKVAEGTPVYTSFIWILVLLPLVSIVSSLASDPATMVLAARSTGSGTANLLGTLVAFAVYGVSVVLAYFDRKSLIAINYDRPFHWAWTFLGSSVYVIGRSIIVRRRSGRGFAIFWTWLALFILGIVIAAIQVSMIFSTVLSTLPTNV